jgi:ubiquinone/menaquinone biosynthesis C-methylase UbiE
MPFGESEFSGAVSFTMLHHVPSQELQNKVFAEVLRVLKPGGFFELVYEDHSYRRHACSRKSRYFRRAIGECGL